MSFERLSILVAAAAFAGIALFYPRAEPLLRKRRIRPPHRALGLVFRLWFAGLAVATVFLLFHSKPHP